MEQFLKEVEKIVNTNVPDRAQVTKVELEGPEIAVYTKNPAAFFENENLVAKLAFDLKKRVNIRGDKSILKDPDEAKKIIEKLIPEDAGVSEILFNPTFSEVSIEALKPGLVIGKSGETSKKIILETGWTPNILRKPTSDSEILTGVRHHWIKYAPERKKLLTEVSKKIYSTLSPNKGWVRLTCLGGFRQVGRSAMLLETPATKVLLDCGTGFDPEDPYPYFEALHFPLSELDAVVISHAHMDHCGFLPYLFRAGYDGPVYCTPPTRDLMALNQFDYVDLMVKLDKEAQYSEKDVKEMLKHIIPRDYLEVTDIAPDMRITFHNAAHILGSASVHVHIGNGDHNLVYSADIKNGFTRLFDNLDNNFPRLETLIIESTYGARDSDVLPRPEAEEKLFKIIKNSLDQNGSVLIPVFAIGRGQEVMLTLEDFYRRKLLPEGTKVFVDGMTKQASAIHTAYPEYLRKTVQRRILQNDSPFTSELFHEVTGGNTEREKILSEGNAIIVASSGMLNGGASLEYLYKMAEDPRNALIFVGWQGEGSLGRKIQQGIRTITTTDKGGKTQMIKLNLTVDNNEAFSGHSDRGQLLNYVRALKPKPKRIIVDHGSVNAALNVAKLLAGTFHINTSAPQNLDALRLR